MDESSVIVGLLVAVFGLMGTSFGLGVYTMRFVNKEEFTQTLSRVHDRIDELNRKLDAFIMQYTNGSYK